MTAAHQHHAHGKCLRRWFLAYPGHGKAVSWCWSLVNKGIRHVLARAWFCMNTGKTWKTQSRGCVWACWLHPLLLRCGEAAHFPLRIASRLARWGGPSREAPLQLEGCCSTTWCAGGNLPIRCRRTWSINYSQVSWRGGIIKWSLQVYAVN